MRLMLLATSSNGAYSKLSMASRTLRLFLIVLAVATFSCISFSCISFAQEATDRASGERTFGAQCAYCHGANGEGAIGPPLAVPHLRRASDEDAVLGIVRDGIPGTQMPPSTLPTAQLRQLAAYVIRMGRVHQSGGLGDAGRGPTDLRGKGELPAVSLGRRLRRGRGPGSGGCGRQPRS